jgi:hypothetical protein
MCISAPFTFVYYYYYCSNPELQKSMKEFGEKIGVVKEDLKVRYKLVKYCTIFILDLLHIVFNSYILE